METLIRLLNPIWVCTVCICHFVSHFGVRNFRAFAILVSNEVFMDVYDGQSFHHSNELHW